jgi:hypothetical protein
MATHQARRRDEGLGTERAPSAKSKPNVMADLKDFLDKIESDRDPAPDTRGPYSPKSDRTQDAANISSVDVPVAHRAFGAPARFGTFSCIMLVLIAAAVWTLYARELAAERRGSDARARELIAHAFVPGSPLACLLGNSGEAVAASCEEALFSTPQATAAAVAYVTAQLSILADGSDYARSDDGNSEQLLSDLREAAEIDRFGIVAHVLSARDGCTPDQCRAFGLMHNISRIKANLHQQAYESHITRYSAGWLTAPDPATRSPSAATPEIHNSGGPNVRPLSARFSFPPSASIPPVSIMQPESPPSSARKK